MELRLLGPPELVIDGRSVNLGGPRQRVVLCLLALNANRVTPIEKLLDAVWGDSLPSTARGQIQICISALRKLFAAVPGRTVIRTQPPGYVLSLEPGELDVELFHTRVAAGRAHAAANRPAEAVAELRAALALWRGPALAGIPSDLLHREATLLEERRNAALEERLRLDLALGRHQELVGELRGLVIEQPLQERLHAFLMLALYRCGRQAEALEVGRRARALLADELGLDPGRELQDMEQAILTRSPTLDLPRTTAQVAGQAPVAAAEPPQPAVVADPPVVPRLLPPSIADFTGREDLLAQIRAALVRDDDSYAMRIVAISGPGGVGKSTLAVRAAHELVEEFPDGQLYADLQTSNVDGGTSRQLARFLRALGVSGTAVPDDPQDRVEMYRSRIAQRRMLVVLDDVTDEEQVLPLLPGSPNCAVITTSRMRLSGLPGAHCITVDALDAEQSIRMLTRIVGAERVVGEPEASSDLVSLCARLPLALRIAGARLASRPHWRVEDLVHRLSDESRRLDEFVHKGLELRSNIGLTYRGLDERARRLFRLCALIHAPDFPGWAAAALLDTSLVEGEDLLESLVDAQVLDVVTLLNERTHRYRFHDLVRVYALERLAEEESETERQAALTRFLGGWLSLSDEAHRREYGGDFTVLHGTAPRWVPRDAPLPERIDDPLPWWERERRGLVPAIRQAAEAHLDEACWDLALTSVTLFETKGYFDDWRETATLAHQAAEAAGNRRGQAASRYSLGTFAMAQKRLDDAEEHFAAAQACFAESNDRHGRALVLRNAAFVSRMRGDTETMLARYAEALTAMREVGDRVGEAHVLASLAKSRIDERDFATARRMLDEAVLICQQAGCLRVGAQVTYRLAELHLATGDIGQARQVLHRTLRVVRDIGDLIGEAYALHALGMVRHREGRLDNAHTTLMHALRLVRQVGDRWIEGQTLFELGQIALARGNDAVGVDLLAQAGELFAALDAPLWQAKTLVLVAEQHLIAGEAAVARQEVEQAAALLAMVNSPEAEIWTDQVERMRVTLLSDDPV